MRDPGRIPGMLQEVDQTWKQYPRKSFTQVICDAVGPEEAWLLNLASIEDDELLAGIAAFREHANAIIMEDVHAPARRIMLNVVRRLWETCPDWRLGQMIFNVGHHIQNSDGNVKRLSDQDMQYAIMEHLRMRL